MLDKKGSNYYLMAVTNLHHHLIIQSKPLLHLALLQECSCSNHNHKEMKTDKSSGKTTTWCQMDFVKRRSHLCNDTLFTSVCDFWIFMKLAISSKWFRKIFELWKVILCIMNSVMWYGNNSKQTWWWVTVLELFFSSVVTISKYY